MANQARSAEACRAWELRVRAKGYSRAKAAQALVADELGHPDGLIDGFVLPAAGMHLVLVDQHLSPLMGMPISLFSSVILFLSPKSGTPVIPASLMRG